MNTVRAHVDDRDRRLRAAADDPLPAAPRGGAARSGLRRHGDRDALGRRRDDVPRGRGAPVRDDHVRPGRRRRGRRRALPRSSNSATSITADVGGTSFDTCLVIGRPAAADVRGRGRGHAGADARGSTSARSAPAAARSHTSTSAACSASARGAPAPSRARPVTGAAAGSRRSPTRRSCSACSAKGELASGIGLDAETAPAPRSRRSRQRLGFEPTRTRPRDCDDRGRQHGERDPRDHDRAGPGSARRTG